MSREQALAALQRALEISQQLVELAESPMPAMSSGW